MGIKTDAEFAKRHPFVVFDTTGEIVGRFSNVLAAARTVVSADIVRSGSAYMGPVISKEMTQGEVTEFVADEFMALRLVLAEETRQESVVSSKKHERDTRKLWMSALKDGDLKSALEKMNSLVGKETDGHDESENEPGD